MSTHSKKRREAGACKRSAARWCHRVATEFAKFGGTEAREALANDHQRAKREARVLSK